MIKTKRLNLKPITEEDAPFLLKLMNSDGWIEYIGDRNVHTIEDVKNYFKAKQAESPQSINYLVSLNTAPIGSCGIYDRKGLEHVDLGFAFMESYHGHGYAFEASKAVLEYHIALNGYKIIQAITLPINQPSLKLLSKLGFEKVKNVTLPNDSVELVLMQLIIK